MRQRLGCCTSWRRTGRLRQLSDWWVFLAGIEGLLSHALLTDVTNSLPSTRFSTTSQSSWTENEAEFTLLVGIVRDTNVNVRPRSHRLPHVGDKPPWSVTRDPLISSQTYGRLLLTKRISFFEGRSGLVRIFRKGDPQVVAVP